MDNKQKMMVLAGINSEEKFKFIVSYDINKNDDQYFPNFSEFLEENGGEKINESLYGFKNADSNKLITAIRNLLNGNTPNDETHIKMITAQGNELQSTSIIN